MKLKKIKNLIFLSLKFNQRNFKVQKLKSYKLRKKTNFLKAFKILI